MGFERSASGDRGFALGGFPSRQYRRPGPLFNLKKTPVQFRRHTNLLGEHNYEVLRGILGLSDEEYESLAASNVIGDAYDPAFITDAEDRA
jgi:crotonobetainyl-CoA:carnitine CoA-transferase CaiB-like acyl-CoA transferase